MGPQDTASPPLDCTKPDVDRWTSGRVRARLVEALGGVRSYPVFSAAMGHLKPAISGVEGAPDITTHLGFLAATAHCLGGWSDDRKMLLSRCSAEVYGRSFREVCRELGWARQTAMRASDRAAAKVADCLNREGLRLVPI